jgi:probable non-F420 flavinoid oxidoreductase
MTRIGYHASHEQFDPKSLLGFVQQAERAGFAAAKCSDHFHPWSARQGQSGFAHAWLGAALQATSFPIGTISAPGYRYHPAILAQSAATLGVMFPDRFWIALGSGEAINESVTGAPWPDKDERNNVLEECVAVMRALLEGETVTHRGRVTVIEAKLYSRPTTAPPLFAAAMSKETARDVATWADGLLTTAGEDTSAVRDVIAAFRDAGGEDKPVVLQAALCWAETEGEAESEAMHQWSGVSIGGEVTQDLRHTADFDRIAARTSIGDLRKTLPISASLQYHLDWIGRLLELEPAELHLHQVGRNQAEFIDTFGASILPKLK